MMFQLVPICFCLLLSLLTIVWNFTIKQNNKTQPIPCWPLVGSLPSLLANSHRIYDWMTEIFFSLGDGAGSVFVQGPIFSRMKYFVTCDPRNMEYILKTNFSNFPKGSDFKQIFDILGDGILNDDGESWRSQRKMVHSHFRAIEFRSAFATITKEVVESELVPFLAHAAENGYVTDLQDIFTRFAFDSNMIAIFGREARSLTKEFSPNPFAIAMDVAQDVVLCRHLMPMFCWKLMRFLNVGNEKRLAEAWKIIDKSIEECISAKRELLKKGVKTRTDLLSMMLKSSDVSDKVLRDVMLSLFFAGKDTLASSLCWFFWLVGKAPHVEKKIMEEFKSIGWKKISNDEGGIKTKWPRVFDIDELKDLVYLHAALCETLRLYAPIPLNSKSVVKEDILPDGTVVTPGTQIIISFFSEGKIPWIWGEDSLEFKPERWIDGNGKLSHELSSKFFAFNVGPRSCLGKDISFTQMKLCVAAVLFNFQVDLVDGVEICSKPGITLHMKNGLPVHIKKRLHFESIIC
ncbi:hypothetical protein ACHQM5_028404 [Ranunculus cassubicifolius]